MVATTATAEEHLAAQLRAVAERHAAEAEVFHTANRLAGLSERGAASLAPFAERFERPEGPTAALPALPGDGEDPHVGLLRDLRHLHVLAAGVVLDWTVLGQGAAAVRDHELTAVVTEGRTQVTRTVKWTTTMLKTGAPQALTS